MNLGNLGDPRVQLNLKWRDDFFTVLFNYIILKLFYFHCILYVLLHNEAPFIAISHVRCNKQIKLNVGTDRKSVV